jgi:arylformamidase
MGASLVDASRPLVSAMPRAFIYPPPVFEAEVIAVQPNGEPVTATRIEMYSHVGTHIESARHIYGAGPSLDSYPLDHFVGAGRAIDLSDAGTRAIEVSDLMASIPDLEPDSFVLLRFGNPVDEDGPHAFLSDEAARWLVERQVRAVGVDTSTPDRHVSQRAHRLDLPVHQILFGGGALIIENLGDGLADACGRHFTVHAMPLNIPGSDSSPVRVVLALRD